MRKMFADHVEILDSVMIRRAAFLPRESRRLFAPSVKSGRVWIVAASFCSVVGACIGETIPIIGAAPSFGIPRPAWSASCTGMPRDSAFSLQPSRGIER